MTPAVVADVGNTRVKWGRCSAAAVTESCSLPPDDLAAWLEQLERWGLPDPALWAVTGVHPARREILAQWLRQRGQEVRVLDDWRALPLDVRVARPEQVGMDRLFDAVAANALRRADAPAVVIDAGSAVTVDYLDASGAFAGGAILPGLRLMARALHDYTALLPLIDVPFAPVPLPATDTPSAIKGGIYWAVAGGIRSLIREYERATGPPDVFLTGGDGPMLLSLLGGGARHWPDMTLEGIRLSAEVLP